MMEFTNNSSFNPKQTVFITMVGQTIDQISPEAGVMYHVVAVCQARTLPDAIISGAGLLGSSLRLILRQPRN